MGTWGFVIYRTRNIMHADFVASPARNHGLWKLIWKRSIRSFIATLPLSICFNWCQNFNSLSIIISLRISLVLCLLSWAYDLDHIETHIDQLSREVSHVLLEAHIDFFFKSVVDSFYFDLSFNFFLFLSFTIILRFHFCYEKTSGHEIFILNTLFKLKLWTQHSMFVRHGNDKDKIWSLQY